MRTAHSDSICRTLCRAKLPSLPQAKLAKNHCSCSLTADRVRVAFYDTDSLPAIGGPGESVITVRAKGDTGLESFDLFVDRQNLGRFDVTTQFTEFDVAIAGFVTADQVRIEYNTDDRGFIQGVDANLTVDYIEIDDQRFKTEDSSTYSSGTGFITQLSIDSLPQFGQLGLVDGVFQYTPNAEFATDGRAYHIDFEAALSQTTTLDASDPNRDEPSDLTWLPPQELAILFDHDNDPETTPLVRD